MRFAPLALLLVALALPVRAQWTPQSPSPTYLDVRGVAAPTPDRVFLATDDDFFAEGGALFESADGGSTWSQRDVPDGTGTPLHGVFFLDSQRGWAFGNGQARTTDSGTTWEPLGLLGTVYDMEFFSPTFGAAWQGNDFHFVSHDAGDTWETSPDTLVAYSFADDLTGLGITGQRVVDHGIYRTTDGGGTFSLVQPGSPSAVTHLTDALAVAIVDHTFYRTTDGGQTWSAGVAAADSLHRLTAVSTTTVLAWHARTFAFGEGNGGMWRSTDGGQTWTDLGAPIEEGIAEIAVLDAQTLVARGPRGGVYRSADGGATWGQTFASPGFFPSAFGSARVAFADAQTGYLSFGPGFVAKTTDGGQTWTQISSGNGSALYDVARFADGSMLAVGAAGTVLTNATGTAAWVQMPSPTTLDLVALDVIGPGEAVTIDENARVYYTDDGGATWTASPTTPTRLNGVDLRFTSAQEGWIAGFGSSEGAVFHTTDGGATWTPAPNVRGSYAAVDAEGDHIWAANSGDLVAYSHDGGNSWATADPGDVNRTTDLDFWDESIGYLVGSFGYVARSDDGGITWTQLTSFPTDDFITDIHLLGANELWLSTGDDRAYYTANGGHTWAQLDVGTPPSASGLAGAFNAITATPAGDAWMVGYAGAITRFAGPPPPPLNRPPEARFAFAASGLTVTFTDQSTDPDGTVVNWAWDFGDSTPDSTSTEQNPTHTFTEAGTYHVRLTVTDDDGETGSRLAFVIVQPLPGGTFGDFTEVTPRSHPLFVTPQDEDFWIATTAPADVDGDGDLDLAALGFYVVYNESVDERLVILLNDGAASPEEWAFTTVDVDLGGMSTGASDLAWADVDGDGDPDLLVGTDGDTALYLNDSGTLTQIPTTLPGYWEDNDQADFDLESISWADWDNDGDPDLLLPSVWDSSTFEYRTALIRNDGPDGSGGWTFTEVDAGIAPTGHAQSQWADADGDGDLDLLLAHLAPLTDDGFVRIYRNDGPDGEGGRTFTGEDVLGLTIEHGEIQWGDADGDGDLDLLVAAHIGENGSFTMAFRLYRNDGGTYTEEPILPCVRCDGWFDVLAARWADYDSDGDIDILLSGTYNSGSQIEGRARIYLNDGAGVFSPVADDLPAPMSSGTRGGTFTWADLEGDGDLDYVIAGQYWVPDGNNLVEAQLHVYRNDAEATNLAPSAPTGLSASATASGEATLSWTPSTDDSTPADALTYDLLLRRDGETVATPRRLPEPGTLGASTSWQLAGLEPGTYTWTVRAVDSAFNGGPVASGTFSVGVDTGTGDGGPLVLALEAPAPNPTRALARLAFTLPEAGEASLEVFDALGRRVATLAEGRHPAGRHEAEWASGDLPAGTYVVRLRAGDRTLIQRATVVR